MKYTPRTPDPLFDAAEGILRGLGMALVEWRVTRKGPTKQTAQGTVTVQAVVYRREPVGVDECSLAHKALIPRLELAFPGDALYLEVSSPGIDRRLTDGREFAYYLGRGVRCYRRDTASWCAGILKAADHSRLVLARPRNTAETASPAHEDLIVPLETIAKAKLDYTQED